MGERTEKPSDIRLDSPQSLTVSIVRARFNREITGRLLEGAVDRLHSARVPDENIHVFQVPGSFELPQAARRLDQWVPDLDGIIAVGAVIRGETPHFDYICTATANGLQDVALEKDYPVIFGVLTCDTREQAVARSGLREGGENKGAEAARAFLEMISFEQHARRILN